MLNLIECEGKRVRLTDIDGRVFEGIASDYIYPEDNEPEGIESIVMDRPVRDDGYKYDYPVEFPAGEIQSIEIIS